MREVKSRLLQRPFLNREGRHVLTTVGTKNCGIVDIKTAAAAMKWCLLLEALAAFGMAEAKQLHSSPQLEEFRQRKKRCASCADCPTAATVGNFVFCGAVHKTFRKNGVGSPGKPGSLAKYSYLQRRSQLSRILTEQLEKISLGKIVLSPEEILRSKDAIVLT
jgi:hypothetical protein